MNIGSLNIYIYIVIQLLLDFDWHTTMNSESNVWFSLMLF